MQRIFIITLVLYSLVSLSSKNPKNIKKKSGILTAAPPLAACGYGGSGSSVPVAVAPPPNSSPTGSVTIAGTATEDQVITASNTLADVDGLGTIGYQWQRDDVAFVPGVKCMMIGGLHDDLSEQMITIAPTRHQS